MMAPCGSNHDSERIVLLDHGSFRKLIAYVDDNAFILEPPFSSTNKLTSMVMPLDRPPPAFAERFPPEASLGWGMGPTRAMV